MTLQRETPEQDEIWSTRRSVVGLPRRRVLALAVGGGTLVLAACGGAATGSGTTALSTPVPSPVASPVPSPAGNKEVLIATTTTTQDTGLLDVLLPAFQRRTGYSYKTIIQGTGAVLALAARGEADVVLSHAPESEKPWMAQGYGTSRRLVMYNDFLIVGPAGDPAEVKSATSAASALLKIAERGALFVSRGDQSGTNVRELAIWKLVAIDPKEKPWYVESGSAQGQTLTIADQRDAYAISDRGTWLAFTAQIKLGKLFEGDPELLNVYHVMSVNKEKFPTVSINSIGGQAFADYLLSPEGQKVIDELGRDKYGEPLFHAVGGKTEADLGVNR